tara:strand:- start:1141 stop:3294 length:2154 start_codon:yes stop_codon:yes gene_type:complete
MGENTIKRGYLSSLEEYKNSLINKFSQYSSEGYEIMMLHRKLNVDYQDSITYLDYINQATSNSNWIGYNNPEHYIEIDSISGDTLYKYNVDSSFVSMLTEGVDAGLEILFQLNGTPPSIPLDPFYKRIPYDIRLIVDGSQNGEQHKEFEIPPPRLFEKYNTVMSNWIKAIEDSVNNRALNPDSVSFIWCGSEEITHTIGWPTDSLGNLDSLWLTGNETDSMRTRAKEINISRYTKMWSGLSKKLDSLGISDGGVQLNASNIDQYNYFKDQLLDSANIPPMDFITIQNYKGHTKTTAIVDSLKLAIDSLRSFDSIYNGLKIIFDRYGFKKNSDGFSQSKAVCSFLNAEEYLISHSDYFYAYCLMSTFYDSLIGDVAGWLNNTPDIRRPIINLPDSIKAMVFSNDEKLNMVIWNNGNSTFTNDIEISNLPPFFSSFILNVEIGSNDTLLNGNGYNFDYTTKTLSGFNLASDEFILITINANNFQKSYVPDDNFELALISYGLDNGAIDDSVYTAYISNIDSLDVSNENIFDLTGIENFLDLSYLNCSNNQLKFLDLNQNTNLSALFSQNNNLGCLYLKNGNNYNMSSNFNVTGNINLGCIEVDDTLWSTSNWTVLGGNISSSISFSNDCNYTDCDGLMSLYKKEKNFSFYPNPFTNSTMFKLPDMGFYTIFIYDCLGNILREEIISNDRPFERMNLSAGIYFFELKSINNTFSGKFVVK